jgi:ribosome-associated heat shock protein Hsp15
MSDLRVDKWLWAVRIYRSRNLATEACRAANVRVNGSNVKPAYSIQLNDVIEARIGRRSRTVKVLALLDHRVGAKLVAEYCEESHPPKIETRADEFSAPSTEERAPGEGRPTKRDRRKIDRFLERS